MQNISYKTSPRARHLRITIKPSGECMVTVPKRFPKFLVERFVAEKADWIEQKQAEMKRRAEKREERPSLPTRPFAEAKFQALHFTTQRVAIMNTHYGFSYQKISVRNQKTRWGSCSKRGNLAFNYRILFLPPHLADYLVVHELCHLAEFNHSPVFWNLVAKKFPNYQELRRELRVYALY
jgi:predicted metal-dependent hydrolase